MYKKKKKKLFAPNNNDPEAKYMFKLNNKNRTFIVLKGIFGTQLNIYDGAFLQK